MSKLNTKAITPLSLPAITLLVVLAIPSSGAAVADIHPQGSSDIYAHFLGKWDGVSTTYPNGKRSRVILTATEEKNGKAMRWDYVYGTKGESGYDHYSKRIVLHPSEHRLQMVMEGSSSEEYKTDGLESLEGKGFGRFYASAFDVRTNFVERCTFDLQPEKFSFQWQRSRDGKTWETYSVFMFSRVP